MSQGSGRWRIMAVALMTSSLVSGLSAQQRSQPLIPGTGTEIVEVGDDFEDPSWSYLPNLPKVLNHKDTALAENLPLGQSANARWHEGIKRGQPDQVERIETPPGGLEGSTGALLLRSLRTGGRTPSHQQQQEDFIANVVPAIGATPLSRSPSVVARVYLPPIEEWEKRTGCHFAFRISLVTDRYARHPAGMAPPEDFDGTFWPGMFINMNYKSGRNATAQVKQYDELYFWMKATENGRIIQGPKITRTGWWTLGMSVTPDGCVHYYARPGVEDLTAEDHIASAWPFGYRARTFRTFFFNVCNNDDGQTWSTPIVIDDVKMYMIDRPAVQSTSQPGTAVAR